MNTWQSGPVPFVPVVPFPTPVPNLPHVVYGAGPDAYGRYFITFHCNLCGDTSQKQCFNPQQRRDRWVLVYASLHQHVGGAR